MRKIKCFKSCTALLLAFILVIAGSAFAEPAPAVFDEDPSGISVTVPEDGVTFHTQLQQEALEAGAEHISEYSNLGKDEFSIPEGISISWEDNTDAVPEKYIISISTNEDMTDAFEIEVPGEDTSLNIQNLMLGTAYYVTVTADDRTSDVYSFTTSDQGPRNLYVDGVTNVRDLGGWQTNDGGYVRQGLMFRCGQLSIDESTEPCITPDGIDVMRNVLGIKTEIDFRRTEDNEQGGITQSPLGEDINYCSEPIGYITDITPDVESIAETFRIMADPDNYPIIYHCKIGTDRTGLITYLLFGLCDVQLDDIYMDYAFSNLGHIEGKRDPKRLDKMINDNFADMGDTPYEIAHTYLTSIGLSDEELDAIVEIMVENN